MPKPHRVDDEIRQLRAADPHISRDELAKKLGVSNWVVYRRLIALGLPTVTGHTYNPQKARRRNPLAMPNPVLADGRPNHSMRGAISEHVAIADLMARGFEVFVAACPTSTCDLVSLKGGKLERIEVKTGKRTTDDARPTCNYPKGERQTRYDRLAIVVPGEAVYYSPPFDDQGLD